MNKKQKYIFRVLSDPWIKPYLQQNKKLLALVIVLGVGTFASAAALMFTSGYLISKSATRPENILLVYIPIVLVRAFGIARPVLKYTERLASHNLVLKSLSSMRVKLYQRLERQALTLKSRYSSGDLLGILAEDVEQLQNLFLRTVFPTIFAVMLYIIAVILLGLFSIPFALLMFLWMFVLSVIFPLVSLLVTRKRHEQMKAARHALYQSLTDAVVGINDWKISGRQSDFLTSYENREKALDDLEKQMT
ncbi:MAG: ABC transporter transmembrane domain-containing protein, partial [Bacillus sp. (in: firmicutes)]